MAQHRGSEGATNTPAQQEKAAGAVALVGVAILAPTVALVAAVVAMTYLRRPDRVRAWRTAAFGLPAALYVAAVDRDYLRYAAPVARSLEHRRWEASVWDVAMLIVWGLAVGPLAGAILGRALQAKAESDPLAGHDARAHRETVEHERWRGWTQAAQAIRHGGQHAGPVGRIMAKLHETPDGDEVGPFLGRYQAGSLGETVRTRRYRKPSWRVRGALRLPWDALTHVVVLGMTGSGKSEGVYRLVAWVIGRLETRDEQVIYINCKQAAPSESAARRLTDMVAATNGAAMWDSSVAGDRHSGGSVATLVQGRMVYDPFRGSDQEIMNRLISIEHYTEPYYRHCATLAVGLALHLLRAEAKPATQLPDVVYSLTPARLAQMGATGDARASELVQAMTKDAVSGAMTRYGALALSLRGWIGPAALGGWSWEDADVCVADLPTNTERVAATALLRMMLADLAAYLGDPRRRRSRRITLVIEEVSALDDDPLIMRDIVNLSERARGLGCRLVLVAQDPRGLGDDATSDRILSSATIVTYQQAASAEHVASFAGTERRVEGSAVYASGRRTDDGSLRMQDTFAIGPNELRQAEVGDAWVISRGRWAKVATALGRSAFRDGPAGRAAADLLADAAWQARALPPSPPQAATAGEYQDHVDEEDRPKRL